MFRIRRHRPAPVCANVNTQDAAPDPLVCTQAVDHRGKHRGTLYKSGINYVYVWE